MGLTGGVKSHRLSGQISPYCEKKRHWLCAYCAPMFLFRIPIPEWTERHSIHSAPRSRMNRMLLMKIQDGGRRDERCGFKYVSTGENTFGHNETLLLISLYQKGNFANDCRRHEEKWLLFVGNKLREQVEMRYFFVPEVRRHQEQEWKGQKRVQVL